jgi:hypothetical protein
MAGFLHRHHESEDDTLYPMVAAANPAATALIDAMAADHGAIQAALDAAEKAVARYARSADGRADLVAALDLLKEVLLPRLRREEDEMMPVVSASITERQWRDWDQAENVKPLPLRELAFTGNWVLDEPGPADRVIIESLVPAVPRWIVKNVFGPGYRKAMFRCWRLPGIPGTRSPSPAPPRVFAYRTQGRLMGDSTEWYFELRADEGGTAIAQHYRVRRLPLWADRLIWWAALAHHDRTAALTGDLERLAALAEREAAVPVSAPVPART